MTHLGETRRPIPRTQPTPRWLACEPERRSADLAGLLAAFAPISLAEMNAVALLDRTDSKYLLGAAQLAQLLPGLSTDYRVLAIDQLRQHQYHTLYFDTADFALYHRHHAGGRRRYKIRSREYVDTNLSFFEVKCKLNPLRTLKYRLQTDQLVTQVRAAAGDFMQAHAPIPPQALTAALWNDFTRITLVGTHCAERVTLDLGLRFAWDGQTVALPGIAVAEVKQGGVDHQSPFMRQVRALQVHQTSFSKYCIGVALVHPQIKHNNLKPTLNRVQSLGGVIHE